jgi:predicted MFS family arabinose efflux permease
VITENPMTALERRTVSSLAMLYSFRMLGLFMVLPLLALYAGDFPDASPTMIGLALGIYGLSQALLQIPLGWLSDRVGRKPVILGGLLMFAVGSLVAAMSESLWGIVLGRALQGAGAIAGTIMALLADLTSEEQRTKAMAVVGMSIGLSFAVALVLGPLVAGAGGLAAVFYLTVGLAGAGMVLVYFAVPTPSIRPAPHNSVGARPSLLGRSFFDARLARLNFGVFTLHFILMACFLVIPALLESNAGVFREQHWKIYLMALTLSVLSMLPMMRVAERGAKPRQMFRLGIALVLIAVMFMGLIQMEAALYLGLWLFFTGFNYLEATLPSLVSKMVHADGRGAAMGAYSTCQFLGAFAGGAVGGLILQIGSAQMLFWVCALLAIIWLLITGPASGFSNTAVDSSSD